MRVIHTLPLVAAFLLVACGGETDADGDGELSADEVAAEAEGMVQPRPGQYRTTAELVEFDVPGMPDSAKEQMRTMMAGGLAEGNTTCLTEEDAAKNGAREMVQDLAEGDCTIGTFNVSGNSVVAEMQCAGGGGPEGTVRMEGEMGAESSTMTMEFDQNLGGAGKAHIKMRMNSERIGECAA
ncbi:MAG TPA: DUF3617 domain-containing protein [Croceibacterium sp.]|nr:DUF3617 domain-containing protein [Croceibacterium sp.]